MGLDHFEKRLARLSPGPAGATAAKVEFITIPPIPRGGRGPRIVAALILVLGLALGAKALLLAQLGEAGLDRMRLDLAEGSPWQRGLALALHPDPVSGLLAAQFGLPGPEDSADTVRLNHESGVALIEVAPAEPRD